MLVVNTPLKIAIQGDALVGMERCGPGQMMGARRIVLSLWPSKETGHAWGLLLYQPGNRSLQAEVGCEGPRNARQNPTGKSPVEAPLGVEDAKGTLHLQPRMGEPPGKGRMRFLQNRNASSPMGHAAPLLGSRHPRSGRCQLSGPHLGHTCNLYSWFRVPIILILQLLSGILPSYWLKTVVNEPTLYSLAWTEFPRSIILKITW